MWSIRYDSGKLRARYIGLEDGGRECVRALFIIYLSPAPGGWGVGIAPLRIWCRFAGAAKRSGGLLHIATVQARTPRPHVLTWLPAQPSQARVHACTRNSEAAKNSWTDRRRDSFLGAPSLCSDSEALCWSTAGRFGCSRFCQNLLPPPAPAARCQAEPCFTCVHPSSYEQTLPLFGLLAAAQSGRQHCSSEAFTAAESSHSRSPNIFHGLDD